MMRTRTKARVIVYPFSIAALAGTALHFFTAPLATMGLPMFLLTIALAIVFAAYTTEEVFFDAFLDGYFEKRFLGMKDDNPSEQRIREVADLALHDAATSIKKAALKRMCEWAGEGRSAAQAQLLKLLVSREATLDLKKQVGIVRRFGFEKVPAPARALLHTFSSKPGSGEAMDTDSMWAGFRTLLNPAEQTRFVELARERGWPDWSRAMAGKGRQIFGPFL